MVEYLPDTNVGNIEYIRREDAVGAVEFGITLASAINIETGEWTELFQRENDELREAVERIKDIKPADVVPVVRCKNCKHHAYDEIFSCYWCEYPGRVRDTTPDGFCEKGKE